jgi:hypothetical protein
MLRPGDHVPFFDVAQVGGGRALYRDYWQRRNLVLACVPGDPAWNEYVASLEAHRTDFAEHGAALVITAEALDELPAPGVAIADRWGEVHYAATSAGDDGTASAAPLDGPAIIAWLEFVQHKCPECEGESR